MGKVKIKKSISKRFKVTKTGKVLFAHQYRSHLRRKKRKRRLRAQKEPGQLKGKFAVKIKKLLAAQ